MRIETTHGELRFAVTPPVEGSNVIGIVGYVPASGDPVPLLPVRSSRVSDADYAIANVLADAEERLSDTAVLCAGRHMNSTGEADAIAAWMRKDYDVRGHRCRFSSLWENRDDEEVRSLVRMTLSATLREDAFRTGQDFCMSMQIRGTMELLRLIEPACERLKEAAKAPDVAVEAALRLNLGFARNPEWSAHGTAWAETVAALEAAATPGR